MHNRENQLLQAKKNRAQRARFQIPQKGDTLEVKAEFQGETL